MKKPYLPVLLMVLVTFLFSCNSSNSNSGNENPDNAAEEISGSDENGSIFDSESEECEKFFSDYESYIDQYVIMAQQFKDNPTDQDILQQFTQMSMQITQWQDKIPVCTSDRYVEWAERISLKATKAAEMFQ